MKFFSSYLLPYFTHSIRYLFLFFLFLFFLFGTPCLKLALATTTVQSAAEVFKKIGGPHYRIDSKDAIQVLILDGFYQADYHDKQISALSSLLEQQLYRALLDPEGTQAISPYRQLLVLFPEHIEALNPRSHFSWAMPVIQSVLNKSRYKSIYTAALGTDTRSHKSQDPNSVDFLFKDSTLIDLVYDLLLDPAVHRVSMHLFEGDKNTFGRFSSLLALHQHLPEWSKRIKLIFKLHPGFNLKKLGNNSDDTWRAATSIIDLFRSAEANGWTTLLKSQDSVYVETPLLSHSPFGPQTTAVELKILELLHPETQDDPEKRQFVDLYLHEQDLVAIERDIEKELSSGNKSTARITGTRVETSPDVNSPSENSRLASLQQELLYVQSFLKSMGLRQQATLILQEQIKITHRGLRDLKTKETNAPSGTRGRVRIEERPIRSTTNACATVWLRAPRSLESYALH